MRVRGAPGAERAADSAVALPIECDAERPRHAPQTRSDRHRLSGDRGRRSDDGDVARSASESAADGRPARATRVVDSDDYDGVLVKPGVNRR
jgi:hypothetical protein